MSKQTGLGDNFYIAGYNVSGDVNSLSRINGGPAALNVTAIDKSAPERLGGKRDGGFTFTSIFNDATGQQHEALKTLPLASRIGTYFHGRAIGSPAASCMAKQIDYNGTRDEEGLLTFAVDVQADGYGLEWGEQLTAGVRTDTAATNGASFDGGASSSFGAQAYLQVFSVTGTSVTVTLEDSADNVSFAAITGGAFSAVLASARSDQRIAMTGTIRRYVRAVTSGTFSNAQFAVQFVRNATAVVF